LFCAIFPPISTAEVLWNGYNRKERATFFQGTAPPAWVRVMTPSRHDLEPQSHDDRSP
jgi:hypothetical protein